MFFVKQKAEGSRLVTVHQIESPGSHDIGLAFKASAHIAVLWALRLCLNPELRCHKLQHFVHMDGRVSNHEPGRNEFTDQPT